MPSTLHRNRTAARRSLRTAALGVSFFLLLAPTANASDKKVGLPKIGTAVGEAYPDFILPKVGGGYVSLSDFRGKRLVLFHFASW